jgi:hypothetical protein
VTAWTCEGCRARGCPALPGVRGPRAGRQGRCAGVERVDRSPSRRSSRRAAPTRSPTAPRQPAFAGIARTDSYTGQLDDTVSERAARNGFVRRSAPHAHPFTRRLDNRYYILVLALQHELSRRWDTWITAACRRPAADAARGRKARRAPGLLHAGGRRPSARSGRVDAIPAGLELGRVGRARSRADATTLVLDDGGGVSCDMRRPFAIAWLRALDL